MHRSRLAAVFGVILMMSFPSAQAPRSTPAPYTVEDLGTLDGAPLTPLGINARGDVVGKVDTSDGGSVAFLLDNGPARAIGSLGGTRTEATAINDNGEVVGFSLDANRVLRAFRYTAATGMLALDASDGRNSVAFAVNASGQIAGYGGIDGYHAFRYTDGAGFLDLGTLGGYSSYGYGINNSGQVAGCARIADDSRHAFVWDSANGMRDLGTLGGSESCGAAINRDGQVAGSSFVSENRFSHAFLYSPEDGLQDLGSLGGGDSEARAINDDGTVVGWSSDATGGQRAFVYTETDGLVDLNSRIDASLGWVLLEANAVNASGQIVGVGLLNGSVRAFRLTPPPTEQKTSDTTPPVIRWIQARPPFLWPPHGGMVPVRVHVTAKDDVDARPACRITGVTSSEPDSGTSRLDRPSDIAVTGDLTVRLRAELAPRSHGRIYTVDVTCADSAGNQVAAQTTVRVLVWPWGWFHW